MATTSPLSGSVNPDELDGQLARGGRVAVVDVRSPGEFAAAHIRGSYNLPLDALPDVTRELGSSLDAPIVLVCQSGVRARQAETELRAAGIERVRVLDGGVTAWETTGLPLERGRGTWSIERQVRAIAGGLVLGGVLGGTLVWRPLVYLSAAVGGGLLYAGVSGNCTLANVLMRLPYNRANQTDVAGVVRRLTTASDR